MRVKAGPDAAVTRLHASTRRPDISSASLATSRCCAIALVAESSTMAPIAKKFFSMTVSIFFDYYRTCVV